MLNLFESLIHPYPEDTPDVPPKTLFAFLYAGTRGLRPLIVVMAVPSSQVMLFFSPVSPAISGCYSSSISERLRINVPAGIAFILETIKKMPSI